MAERKVINKHYPDDFDPSKIPRRRQHKKQMVVRMMLPMTVRCAACGEYIGRGTKFNSRKEDVAGERYLGAVQVFRFYIRCSRCSAEIVFRTDPASAGYALERIDDGDDEDDEEDFFESCLARAAMATTSHQAKKRPPPPPRDAVKSLVVSKKRRPESMDQAAWPPSSGKTTASNGALQVLCCNYDDEE
uniref:Splicing factor YJU2 n=1 Tax=Oryza barthii TaxID=65489 RepID=A0A0D3EQP0_9ORYZ